MNEILKNILSSGITGNLSSKRVITVLAALTVIVAAYANIFFNYHIDNNILDALMWITISGLGFVSSEQFANMFNNKKLTIDKNITADIKDTH